MKSWVINRGSRSVEWSEINALKDFSYPWLKESCPLTAFKAYYDSDFLYFQFTALGGDPKVYVENNDKLEVRYSERVELFFRSSDKMDPYYCLEMDPYGRILDYKATLYRNFDRNWTWPDPLDILINKNGQEYTLEGKIMLCRLEELGLLIENQIQVGIYRGHCIRLDKKEESIKWISWVDPKTTTPDFHVPDSFGLLRLI